MTCMHVGRAISLVIAVLFAVAASAEPSSTQRSRGRVFAVDAATHTVTVLESDGTHAYRLAASDRAAVTRDGHPLALAALRAGTPVMVYWQPSEGRQELRRAVKIDVPTVPKDAPRDLVDSLLELEALPAQSP